jgi:hypothetical protein
MVFQTLMVKVSMRTSLSEILTDTGAMTFMNQFCFLQVCFMFGVGVS